MKIHKIGLITFKHNLKFIFKKMSYGTGEVDVKKYYNIVSTCLNCPNTKTIDKEKNVYVFI